jgi:hypothetical protein
LDIWIGLCHKTAKCDGCGEDILPNTPAVFGRIWKSYDDAMGGSKKWSKKLRWHARKDITLQCCWVEQGLTYLTQNPYKETRGRKTLILSAEVKRQRQLIMLRRGRVMQQLREEMEILPTNTDRIIILGNKLEMLKDEISTKGGVPKSWE